MFVHHVVFYLKKNATRDAADRLIKDGHELLSKIPTVRHLWAGRPAGTDRAVVDNAYGIGLCVVLDDAKGHDVYQEHQLHKDFIERNAATWETVQVRDFID